MPRFNQPRSLGALTLVALAVTGCGAAGKQLEASVSAAPLHGASEHRLLELLAIARADAARHDPAGVRAALREFMADVNALRAAGELSSVTAAALDRQARAAEALAGIELRSKGAKDSRAIERVTRRLTVTVKHHPPRRHGSSRPGASTLLASPGNRTRVRGTTSKPGSGNHSRPHHPTNGGKRTTSTITDPLRSPTSTRRTTVPRTTASPASPVTTAPAGPVDTSPTRTTTTGETTTRPSTRTQTTTTQPTTTQPTTTTTATTPSTTTTATTTTATSTSTATTPTTTSTTTSGGSTVTAPGGVTVTVPGSG